MSYNKAELAELKADIKKLETAILKHPEGKEFVREAKLRAMGEDHQGEISFLEYYCEHLEEMYNQLDWF